MQGDDYTLGNVDDLDPSEWQVPPHCIPIHANVMTYDWSKLSSLLQFDVIMMDPPWQLATANPTRGDTDAHEARLQQRPALWQLQTHPSRTDETHHF